MNETIEKQKMTSIPLSEAIEMAKCATSDQDKFDLIVRGAVHSAERTKGTADMRTKCGPFFEALKQGSITIGFEGRWLAEVVHDVRGYDKWNIQTDLIQSPIIDGNDGCRYFAAFFKCNY